MTDRNNDLDRLIDGAAAEISNQRLDEIFSRPDRTLRLLLEMKATEP